jgi:hypothetical protein
MESVRREENKMGDNVGNFECDPRMSLEETETMKQPTIAIDHERREREFDLTSGCTFWT